MLRMFVVLMAVGVVLYGFGVLTPQTSTAIPGVPNFDIGNPIEAIKSRWLSARADSENEVAKSPDDSSTPQPAPDTKPGRVLADDSGKEDTVPGDKQASTPAVNDVILDAKIAKTEKQAPDFGTVTATNRHKNQHTDRDVLAVHRESAGIFKRIERIFNGERRGDHEDE